MPVRVLSDIVASQIAAGEVVERPVSIVRELVDNALDADSGTVLISLEGGGTRLVRVVDDGIGMNSSDALLAFERHATSKITEFDDLLLLSTRGFRGEALAAIASVSRVELITAPRDALTNDVGAGFVDVKEGTVVRIHGGKVIAVDSVPAAKVGSSVAVHHLFFNTPVRRKFLKSERTELSAILNWVTGTSLTAPSVRFLLSNDGKEVFSVFPATSFIDRARHILQGTLVPISLTRDCLSVTGLLGHPAAARSTAAPLYLLVNNRLIRDAGIVRATREGFGTTLRDRELPVGVLSITLPPSLLDINVHPQKAEVRFAVSGDIYTLVRDAVVEGFATFRAPISIGRQDLNSGLTGHYRDNSTGFTYKEEIVKNSSSVKEPSGIDSSESFLSKSIPSKHSNSTSDFEFSVSNGGNNSNNTGSVPFCESFRYQDIRFIGQVLGVYLVGEWNDQCIILDAHAAHERVNFARLLASFNANQDTGKEPTTQRLLLPITLPIPDLLEDTLCQEMAYMLTRVGIEIEVTTKSIIVIGIAPIFFTSGMTIDSIASVVTTTIQDFAEAHVSDTPNRVRDFLLSRLACHASVRRGDKLSSIEINALAKSLDEIQHSSACPHGRPISISLSANMFTDWFARTV